MEKLPDPDPGAICFGLSPDLDRRSCAAYLRLLGRVELAETLSSRLSSAEIESLVDVLGALLRAHLSDEEYHRLFLGETHDPVDGDWQ